jgi:dipeptidyl aminopeptidase/acylaminoacyl peptidase
MKSFRAVAVVLVWFGMLGLSGVAQQPMSQNRDMGHPSAKRPMTFADLMAMKRVSDPQISPSGKWVMFSVMDVSLEKNTKVNHLWVVPLPEPMGNATPIQKAMYGGFGKMGPEFQVTFGDGETFGRFSPDGKWVSMTMQDQIFLAPWDEALGKVGMARQLTSVRGGGADGAIWSPDSKRLMFTADVYPECSDKPMWAEENACDKAKDDAAAASPVKGQVWDALLYRHWDQYTGLKRSHILVVDFVGNVRDLTPASAVGDAETPTWMLGGPLEYAWAPDSKEIAYVTNLDPVPAASTNNDVFTLRLDEPDAKAVKVSTSLGSDDEPEYSPDGKWLAFRSQARAGFESDRFRLMLYDREKKMIKELLPNLDRWVDEFAWSPHSGLMIACGDAGRTALLFAAVDGTTAGTYKPLIGSDEKGQLVADFADISDLHISPNGMLVVAETHINKPTEIVATDLTTMATLETVVLQGEERKEAEDRRSFSITHALPPTSYLHPSSALTHQNDALLGQLSLAQYETFKFAGADGTPVQGFITRPPNFDPAKKYPLKFVMHGGPQTALGDSWSYRWNWELLAADGYVVVGINRRGSTGYGQKFVDEVSGDWGGRAYEDLMKGLDYAEKTYPFIDKTRECALGASYGGYMADWVLTHTNRFRCVVTHDGMFDPVSAYGTTEEMWFNEWEFRRPEDYPKGWDGFSPGAKQTAAGHAAEPWRYQNLPADQDPFRKWSPMRFIENAKTPTLIVHSQRDYRLDVSQGFELYTALQRRGVPSRFLYFPDEGHWVLKPQNSQLWYDTVNDWCDRWTRSGKYAEKQ